MRMSLPAAYADPAFVACLHEAIETPELVTEFDRLYSARMLAGKPSTADMRAFSAFVHDCIYMPLPDDAIKSLRATALAGT